MKESFAHHISVVAKGMAMGAADVVPGVSGGTIAFITGIYTQLIRSLSSCDYGALQCLFSRGPVAAWKHINGTFLLTLFTGILISVFSLANLVTNALDTQPILVWSFFFGLVAASTLHLLRQIRRWTLTRTGLLFLGVLTALIVSHLKPAQLPDVWWVVMLAGMIAICAMLLPGISGGFLLLLMGLYTTVVEAISQLNFTILIPFGLGCGLGLLAFSHILSWLLSRFETATMAFLTGILLGSLNIIWPWRQTLERVLDRHGEWIPVIEANVSPFLYSKITGNPSHLYSAITLCALGFLLVFFIEWVAKRGTKRS